MKKPKLALLLSLALLAAACGPLGQAPGAGPESPPESESPVSISEPAPEPEPSPEPEKEQRLPPKADDLPLSPQEEVNPDFGSEDPDETVLSSDPVNPEDDEVLGPLIQRESALNDAIALFFLNAPEDAYSYYRVALTADWKLKLEVGVIDDAAIDQFLASYTGESWDELVKRPGHYSVAKQNGFLEAIRQLELEPGVHVDANSFYSDTEKFDIHLIFDHTEISQEEAERWSELPQAIKDLAMEMGIQEEALDYIPPRYTPSGNHPD